MATVPKVITYEEWLRMPVVEDAIEEVVNGEIRIMPPPKLKHTLTSYKLRRALEKAVHDDRFMVVEGTLGIVIRREPLTSRVPDIAICRQDTPESDGYVDSPPEFVAEILSPSNTRRQRQEKLDDYASLGVPEVWVVSPEARTVEVLRLEQGKLRTVQIVAEGVLRPVRFPDAAVEVSSIWPD